MLTTSTLNVADNCLLVYVDETGHEKLAGGHTVFGVGGCAVLARALLFGLHNPWKDVRKIVNGDPTIPLHASHFTQKARSEHIQAVADFFALPTFYRLASVGSVATTHPDTLALAEVMLAVLGQRIQEIADRAKPDSVAVIFEHTERAAATYERYFGALQITKNGVPLPVELCWMPKAVKDPALEVADFIMHAVHGQEKDRLTGKLDFRKDFRAVFMNVSSSLVSFMRVDNVDGPQDAEQARGEVLG